MCGGRRKEEKGQKQAGKTKITATGTLKNSRRIFFINLWFNRLQPWLFTTRKKTDQVSRKASVKDSNHERREINDQARLKETLSL